MHMLDPALQDRLSRAVGTMSESLYMSTGIKPTDRKLIAYWTIATHLLPNIDTFPLLVLKGQMATGKSETLKIVSKFSHKPRLFSVHNSTAATTRNELDSCFEGTAVIEEADQVKDNAIFEALLSDRYQRSSANAGVMERGDNDKWQMVRKRLFGATALHKRVPFADAALDGRSIIIHMRADHSREYVPYADNLPWIIDGSNLVADLSISPPPREIAVPSGIAPRVFNSYRPLFMLASLINEYDSLLDQARERLLIESASLKEAQSEEPDGLVCRAILNIVASRDFKWDNIKFSAIAEWIWQNYQYTLQPRQVGGLARDLRFTTKQSHGVAVVVPTPATLLKACHDCGYDNAEEINELKRSLIEPLWVGQVAMVEQAD